MRLKSCMCVLNVVQRSHIPTLTYNVFEASFGRLLDANAVYTGTHQHIVTSDAVSDNSRVAIMQQRLSSWLEERLHVEGGRVKGLPSQAQLEEQAPDAIICVGGDGTLASLAEALASSSSPRIQRIPVIPVPSGLMNGVCSSLGISRIVRKGEGDGKRLFENVFNPLGTRSVPLWRVTMRDATAPPGTGPMFLDMRALGTVGMGLYAHWMASSNRYLTLSDYFPMLPSLGPRPSLAAAFAQEVLLREQRLPMRIELQQEGKGAGPASWTVLEEPNQLCVASQFSHQLSLLSLTPQGSFSAGNGPFLGVTTADASASQMRLVHLFTKEGYVGGGTRWSMDVAKAPQHRSIEDILAEDGVNRYERVTAMRWVNTSKDMNMLAMVDGEPVKLPAGMALEVTRCPTREQVTLVV